MAYYYDEPSRTFNEYLSGTCPVIRPATRIPASAEPENPAGTSYRKGQEECPPYVEHPHVVSAIMAAVSDDNMAVALATEGGS